MRITKNKLKEVIREVIMKEMGSWGNRGRSDDGEFLCSEPGCRGVVGGGDLDTPDYDEETRCDQCILNDYDPDDYEDAH